MHILSFVALLVAVSASCCRAQTATRSSETTPPIVVFHNVRVFDGERLLPGNQTVIIKNGKIATLGPVASIPLPKGTSVSRIEGNGSTLLPGLIDAHAHVFGEALTQALVFGVTTEMDMFTDFHLAATMRSEQVAGKARNRADLFSAGTLVTAPGGHGTEYGFTIPTITRPDEAQAFVDARIAEGSDYIKVVLDDGSTYGGHIPTLDRATLKAVIIAAHKRGKKAVVHVGSYADAKEAIELGADGLAHLFVDRAPDPDFGRFVSAHHAFVVPTLAVLESVSGGGGTSAPATSLSGTNSPFAPYLTAEQATTLARAFPKNPRGPKRSYEAATASVRLLKAAHVPILAGTDSPNPGTAHGASLHHEMQLLVEAGLTPAEALTAATAAPAAQFGLKDRGRIAPGCRADLLLVEGNPLQDITVTRRIRGVWKQGVPLDRAGYREARQKERNSSVAKTVSTATATSTPSALMVGVVSDFEEGKPVSKFGAGWSLSTDQLAGGKSEAQIAVVSGGAEGSGHALSVTGTVAPGLPYAWSGVLFSPGAALFTPVDLSAKKEIRFWAKNADSAPASSAESRSFEVMFFSQGKGQTPLIQRFTAGPQWKEFVFKIADFGGIDGHDLLAVVFAAGPEPGPFSFQIDSIRFQ